MRCVWQHEVLVRPKVGAVMTSGLDRRKVGAGQHEIVQSRTDDPGRERTQAGARAFRRDGRRTARGG